MSRRPIRQATDKIIHIRIDAETHKKLKLEAALKETSVQQIVERILKKKFHLKK